ncbi:capsular biosynthesis protein [Photobacterium piscicola]|uniref:capsular biosynthesis protein n=1 Tax=Photobacterium piscicola TaxID=1378299 RepID=UPI002E1735CD|nr:capsular biosynthesis protein [Photobacterium piscicola]MEC6883319.1 capsular biosynthesis protein [Photobacterium piscicola]
MFLIMSAAYVGQDLKSEFGNIPPSLLPLGNRRLFQHQIAAAPKGKTLYLSLPESYNLPDIDAKWLQQQNVTVLSIPDNISLGASLVIALNLIEKPLNTNLEVLFGDTLITPLHAIENSITVSQVEDSYNWSAVTNSRQHWIQNVNDDLDHSKNNVVSGYFHFSQPRQLIRCITQSHWDFLEGLNRYNQLVGLTTVRTANWLDFGHVNTYYRSKAKFTTQRAFNQLKISPEWCEKSSINGLKIKAEANWFRHLPPMMRNYIPQYMGHSEEQGRFSYRLEYLHHTALNELFVFANLPTVIWRKIIHSSLAFLTTCQQYTQPTDQVSASLEQLFGEKTSQRLNEFCQDRNYSLTTTWCYNKQHPISLQQLVTDSHQYLPKSTTIATVMHGDFCFSNILYDFRTNRIKTIDPRGITPDGTMTLFGDIRYDIAKLSHSILGLYDWIIAGYYHVNMTDNTISFDIAGLEQHQENQQMFIELVNDTFNLSAVNLYAMQIQLFLSMLPLHADDPHRQDALMANAFRLHQLMVAQTL